MHDEQVDERIRDALAGNDGQAPIAAEGDPVGAVRSRVRRRRRRRRGAAGAAAVSAVLIVGLFAVGSADSEPEDVQTAAREAIAGQSNTPSSAEDGDAAVAPECGGLAEETGTRALASTDAAGLCALLDMARPEAPRHGAVRFFLDGEPVATVGLDPCPIPEAFAVPSAAARPLPGGTGHRITGTLPVPADDVRAALAPLEAVSDRVVVGHFPELQASLYVVDQHGATVADALDRVDAATAHLRTGVSSPECALEAPRDAPGDQTVGILGGQCGTRMLEVAAGDGWTLSRGVTAGLPSLYEVTVDGELKFGGCGSDARAKEAGYMPWFSAHVPDGVLLFGEVPAGVRAVAVNGDVVEAVEHQGTDSALVIVTLPYSDGDRGNVTLEAVRFDGSQAPLPPAVIGPNTDHAFALDFGAV